MIIYAVATVLVGLAIGAGSMSAAHRSAPTHEQSVRRQRLVQGCFLGTAVAVLIFDAVDTHRYFNLALVALAVAGLLFDSFRARRTKPS